MELRYAYNGTLNGIKGVWTDKHPEEVVVEKVIMFITADDGHELQNKETKERRSNVIIQNENEMNNWEEVECLEKEIDDG